MVSKFKTTFYHCVQNGKVQFPHLNFFNKKDSYGGSRTTLSIFGFKILALSLFKVDKPGEVLDLK